MRKLGIAMAVTMILGLAGGSFAQTYHHGQKYNINKRQAQQQKRIEEGVQKGRLTPRETQGLIQREAKISDREAKYRASGDKLTLRERAKLESDLNRANRDIYRQNHDRQGANPASYNINQRQENQTSRIQNGVQNGSLTAQETQRLTSQEARISDLEAKKRASGGKLTVRERAELDRLLNAESGRIYRQTHDKQDTKP